MSASVPFDGRQVASSDSDSDNYTPLIATISTPSIKLGQTRSVGVQFKVALGTPTNTAVRLATTGALAASTYANGTLGVGATLTANANGALSIDSVAVANGNRVLIKNQAAGAQNGIYVVTDAGSAGTPFILTRATDCDQAAEVAADILVAVTLGTMNTGKQFLHHGATITMGTTAITWEAGEPVGTLTIEISNNRKETPQASDLYDDDDGSFCALTSAQYTGTITAVNGAALEFPIVVPFTPFRRLRIHYAATTGTGVLDAWITGQG